MNRYQDFSEENSRTELWANRFDEFESSPLIGIGFSRIITTRGNEANIEPGSSWLAVLSMTGLLGFICFIFFVFGDIKFLINKNNDFGVLLNSFLVSLISFFSIHMIAEGYIYSSGHLLFFYFWLLFGVIEGLKTGHGKYQINSLGVV